MTSQTADGPAPSADDHTLAAEVAAEAGRLLVRLRRERAELPPRDLKDEGDRQANDLITARLRAARPHDAILSEEAADDLQRLEAERVWIVDPLDGTREFGEGRVDWAVHVALAVGGTAAIGAVALPAEELVLATSPAPTLGTPAEGRARRVVTSRTRMPEAASRVAEALGADLMPLGSAGAKTMAVVRGEADAYAHAGGMYQWDSAAPVAVAAAAGLHVSRVDGSPLVYNLEDPWLPDLLVCRPELADTCLAALAGL